jgi:2-keto-4-pentenoate hydratase/2-oxohepta-3-ene-1,7-dioic acid hydratase in catechol pathway
MQVTLTDFYEGKPRPGKIICLAGNYRKHIAESGYQTPQAEDIITPQLFLKPATCLIADGQAIPLRHDNAAVGWEVELAVVMGEPGRDIPAAHAYRHVFGYTILNDISERQLNSGIANRHKRENDAFFDWLAGKWFDGFAPCGPVIVTHDEMGDPHNLGIRLWVNGELHQDGNTSEMIFPIPELVEKISSIMTLERGDIISTGTPAGAGLGDAKKALTDGDELVCEVDRIGRLRNVVRRAR